jgi:hypothetical protein
MANLDQDIACLISNFIFISKERNVVAFFYGCYFFLGPSVAVRLFSVGVMLNELDYNINLIAIFWIRMKFPEWSQSWIEGLSLMLLMRFNIKVLLLFVFEKDVRVAGLGGDHDRDEHFAKLRQTSSLHFVELDVSKPTPVFGLKNDIWRRLLINVPKL